MLTSSPGASVTLTCPGGGPEDNGTVHWVLRSQDTGTHRSTWAGLGRRLVLRPVQLSYSGNYSCYQDGRQVGSVRLLVEGELCRQSSWSQLAAQLCPFHIPRLTLETPVLSLACGFRERPTDVCRRDGRKFLPGGGNWLTDGDTVQLALLCS